MFAQDARSAPRKRRQPSQVEIVQDAPLDVAVTSLPSVTVANPTLDVRVTNDSIVTTTPGTSVVTLDDLTGTIAAETVSAEVDVDGYRSATVFFACDGFSTAPNFSSVLLSVEFGCAGMFESEQDASDTNLDNGGRAFVVSRDVVGPKLRVRLQRAFTAYPFPTLNNAKAVVYLRR